MGKKLKSIFTDNMNRCLVTGIEATEDNRNGIEIHHIFSGADRKRSERFPFCVPLHKSVHPNGAMNRDKNWVDLDHWLKRMCQEWYVEVAHIGTKDDFYKEFGRFYDDRCDEKVWLNGRWTWDLRKEK